MMKARQAINKHESESNTHIELENQQTPESNGLESAVVSQNRATMPPAGTPGVTHHADLVKKSQHSNSAYSQQFFHHLQRTHGNRYVQRVVELSRKGDEAVGVDQDIEQTIQSKRGAGHAMDNGIRQQMEGGFGQDFSAVRVHTDNDADSLNKNLNARAFTTGSDVFFRGGEYRPGSSRGRELLAHELTHVVQQGGSEVKRQNEEDEDEQIEETESEMQTKLTLGQPNDKYEQEADAVAQRIMRQEYGEHSASQANCVSPTAERIVQKSIINVGLAPQSLIQLSPLSDELTSLWQAGNKGAFFERLRNVGVPDPDVYDFITNNLGGDDLWLARNLFLHGREASWPIHLRVEREMKGWGDSGGKGVVFDILRTANGSEAVNAALMASLNRIFASGSDDIWLARNLQAYGVEASWPIHLRVEREMKGWGDSGGSSVVFDILRAANGSETGNAALTASISLVFAAGSDDLWRAQNIQAYGPEVNWPIPVLIPPASVSGEQVDFTGSHALASYGGDPRIQRHWTQGAIDHATAYTKSSTPALNARFVVGNNLTRANISAVNVRVKEGGTVLGATAPLTPGASSIDVAGLVLAGLSGSADVRSSNYHLVWEASVDGGATWGPITSTGVHPVYWLHGAPTTAPLYNFAVAKATGYVAGAGSVAASVRTGLRGDLNYSPSDAINADPLSVYADGVGICTDFANLLTLLARSVGFTANSVMFWGGFHSLGKNIWVTLGGGYNHINLVNVRSTNPAYNMPTAPISPLGWAFNYHAISRIGGVLQDAALDIQGINAQAAHDGKVVRLLEPASSPMPPGSVGAAYSETIRRRDHTVGVTVRDYGAQITGATFSDVYPLVFPAAATSPYDVPVTWSITAGTLPAGLALNSANGLIHGTPTAAGTSTVTIEDQAPGGTNHTFPLTIIINP